MRNVVLTVDLGFGDAGKGSIVDFLTRDRAAHTVVRYNGGPQAGHRVVAGGARTQEHVFAQFGSGTLAGAATHLSRFMLLDPPAMVEEGRHLHELGVDALERTTVDERALVVTPFQRAINRLKELARGDRRHGSCGMGIGETMADYLAHGERVLFAGDLRRPDVLRRKLSFLRDVNLAKSRELSLPDTEIVTREREPLTSGEWIAWLIDGYDAFARQVRIVPGEHLHTILGRPGTVVFEGAQGVLLDEWYGFHPHTTWSTTTLENADRLLGEADYTGAVTRIGITRGYATRHGAGPLVTEDAQLTRALPDARNGVSDWQQGFRVGWLDLVVLRYALEVTGGVDALAVTCLDRLAELPELMVSRRYLHRTLLVDRIARTPVPRSLAYQAQLTHNLAACRPVLETVADAEALPALLAAELGVPVELVSHGPTAEDKRYTFLRQAGPPARLQPLLCQPQSGRA